MMAQLMRAPVDFIGETQGYRPANNPNHYGIDLGWSTAHGGPHHPILAASDCEVVKAGTMTDGAKYVVTRTDGVVAGKYVYCLFWHLSRIDVAAGQQLKMGDRIGLMGSTGTASGVHLHLEVWVTPLTYSAWKLSDKTKYAVDPHDMIYAYADQKEGPDTASKFMNTDKTLSDGVKEGASEGFFPPRGYFRKGDISEHVGRVAQFMYTVFPAYTDKKALGNCYGSYIIAAITEFQRRTGLTTDGILGPVTLAELEKYGFTSIKE